METTYCSNCGSKISKDAKFCGNCGEEINLPETKKNNCPGCGYVANEDEKFCPDCGTALTLGNEVEKTPKSQPKPAAEKKPRPVAKTTTTPPLKKKKGDMLRTLGKVALWGFAIVVLGVVALYFIGDSIDSPNTLESAPSTVTDIAFNPEPVKGSGTKAFEIEPIQGVILSADENALDKVRDFTVSILEDEELYSQMDMLPANNIIPLVGLDIDSDMQPDEQFPGVMTVSIDLDAFNIDSVMRSDLRVVRTEDDGSSVFLRSEVDGNRLTFTTSKNSLFQMVVAITIGLRSVVKIYDNKQKFGGKFGGNYDYTYSNDIKGYTILWSNDQPVGNPTEVDKYQTQLIQILKNNGLSEEKIKSMSGTQIKNQLEILYNNDVNYKRIKKVVSDKDWKRNNLYPKEIKILMDLLEIADNYLFGNKLSSGRGFKRYDNVDIIAFDTWPFEKNVPAQCINTYSLQPYVQVNLSKRPHFRSSAMKDWTDEMLTNLVHEIFHTCQVRHLGTFSIDKEKDTWFWEATAIAVEKQAREYFEKHQIISKRKMIISQQNSNYCQKNIAFVNGYQDPIDLQNQGYAYAPLIEYISDQYSAKTGKPKENYINYALEKYVEIRNPRATLVKTTTNSNHGFEKFYKNFCHESLTSFIKGYALHLKKKFPFPSMVNLTKEFPIYKVDHDYESLSMTMRKFKVSDADSKKDHSVKLVLRGIVGNVMSYVDGFSIATTSSTGSKNYRELKQPRNMSTDEFDVEIGFGTVANENIFYLQDVNYDMDNSVKRSYEVFAMYKPATPSLTFDKLTENWYIKIKYDESNLKDMDYVDAYKITLRCPNGDIYSFITEENDFELPISYDKQTLSFPAAGIDFIHSIELTKADDNSTITGDFRLLYRELTSSDAKVMGPQSMPIKLAVDGIVDLTANTDELLIDEKINYKVTVAPDKKNYTYYWFMDGLVDQEGGSKLQVTFKEAGTYTAKVTVSDENGKNIGSDSWTCTVTSVTSDVNQTNPQYYRLNFDNKPSEYVYAFYKGQILAGRWDEVDRYMRTGLILSKNLIKLGVYTFNTDTQTYHGDFGEGGFTAVVKGEMIMFYNKNGKFFNSGTRFSEDNPAQFEEKIKLYNYDGPSIMPDGDEVENK